MSSLTSKKELNRFSSYFVSMLNKSRCNSFLWMPYIQSPLDQSSWYQKNDKTLAKPRWLNWEPGQPNGQGHQPCSAIESSSTTLSDLPCTWNENCFACNFKDITMFELRGLCPELLNIFDNRYLIDTAFLRDNINKDIIWTGFQKSQITLDMETNLWTLTNSDDSLHIKMKT